MVVGDALGLLHIVEVPRSLRRQTHSDGKGMAALVQRELDRLDWLASCTAALKVRTLVLLLFSPTILSYLMSYGLSLHVMWLVSFSRLSVPHENMTEPVRSVLAVRCRL